jgi:hypothetical protein
VFIGILSTMGWAWLAATTVPKRLIQHVAVGFLEITAAGYFLTVAVALSGVAVLGWIIWRAARERVPSPRSQSRAARWLLLSSSCMLGLGLAEAVAALRLAYVHRLPAMAGQFAELPRTNDEVVIAVIGGSSALGVPYEGWISVGAIVGHELEHLFPSRRFRVEVLAEKGASLEAMHLKLASFTRRPDVLIVYAGHNEFLARFSLSNRVPYYDDELSLRRPLAWLEHARGLSPLLTLILENLEKERVGVVPKESLGVADTVVGHPVCTPAKAAEVAAGFERHLEAIVADCEHIGCLPILIIPPGNDASSPNQSFADPGVRAAGRRALYRRLVEIRALEEDGPDSAIAAYREFVAEQPTHAEAHYRLARLLKRAGLFAEANRHFIVARDCDGLPMRCIAPLETAYRAVARRHAQSAVLVDGPAVLKAKSRDGILDLHLFHDNVHPTLAGHVALAGAVLAGLKARGALGWPEPVPAPVLNSRSCAAHFGIDAAAWAVVCDRCAVLYGYLAFLSIDSAERVSLRDRYAAAAHRIRAGVRPEDVGIPGVGNR